MCLVTIARPPASGRYRLAIAANRDEAHERPTEALHWWPDAAGVAGGRDGIAGGSWLAVRRDGRFAALLNTPATPPSKTRSRGELVRDFVTDDDHDAARMQSIAHLYAGFHALIGDLSGIHHVASLRERPQPLTSACEACGNFGPDQPGPRIERARRAMPEALAAADPVAALFRMLADTTDPGTGSGDNRPVFIRDPVYGTRSSSLVLFDGQGRVGFHERRFDRDGNVIGERSLGWSRTSAA